LNLLFVVFLLLGIACILAAIKYTVGSNAYGYRGLGDIAVFCFFGWVGVIGTFLLNDVAEEFFIPPTIFIPASGIGLLCTAVLNTNNIRDIKNDADSGKMTIPVKIGLKKARLYHSFLVFGGLGCLLFYSFYFYYHPVLFVQLPASCLIVYAATQVLYTEPGVKYNSLLKSLSLGILLFTVTYVFSLSFASIANATQELIP
jgi:1,4-dihydroxy-2-naphthoate octaprenyltransferase